MGDGKAGTDGEIEKREIGGGGGEEVGREKEREGEK